RRLMAEAGGSLRSTFYHAIIDACARVSRGPPNEDYRRGRFVGRLPDETARQAARDQRRLRTSRVGRDGGGSPRLPHPHTGRHSQRMRGGEAGEGRLGRHKTSVAAIGNDSTISSAYSWPSPFREG